MSLSVAGTAVVPVRLHVTVPKEDPARCTLSCVRTVAQKPKFRSNRLQIARSTAVSVINTIARHVNNI